MKSGTVRYEGAPASPVVQAPDGQAAGDTQDHAEDHLRERAHWPARIRAAAYTGSLGVLTLTAYALLARQLGFAPGQLALMALLVAAPLACVEFLLREGGPFRAPLPRRVAHWLLWPFAALPSLVCLGAMLLGMVAMWTLWLYGAAAALLGAMLGVLHLLDSRRG